MDNKIIANIFAAWQDVVEKKKLDPVGKADADIDNDGDVDKSDEYLHKRRKAIKKAMKEEDEDDIKMDPKGMSKCSECGGSNQNHNEECSKYKGESCGKDHKMKKESVRHEEFGYGEVINESDGTVDVLFDHGVEFDVPAEQLESIRRAMDIAKKSDGAMTPAVKKINKMKKGLADNPRVQKALKKANEEEEVDAAKTNVKEEVEVVSEQTVAEFDEQIQDTYSSIQQQAIQAMKNMWEFNEHPKSSGPDADHKKGATAPETMKDKRKGKAADDMANDHDADNPSIDDTEEKSHDDVSKAARAVKSQAPKRGGEERVGHLSPEMPVDTTKVGKGGL
jgi:hypothetical protein